MEGERSSRRRRRPVNHARIHHALSTFHNARGNKQMVSRLQSAGRLIERAPDNREYNTMRSRPRRRPPGREQAGRHQRVPVRSSTRATIFITLDKVCSGHWPAIANNRLVIALTANTTFLGVALTRIYMGTGAFCAYVREARRQRSLV